MLETRMNRYKRDVVYSAGHLAARLERGKVSTSWPVVRCEVRDESCNVGSLRAIQRIRSLFMIFPSEHNHSRLRVTRPVNPTESRESMSNFRKLLVTTDFSTDSLGGVRAAAELARQLDAEVMLLYVVEDHLPPILGATSGEERQGILEKHRRHAEESLREYAVEHLADCRAGTATVVGVAARDIIHYAEGNEIDLIIMASRGYGPIRQLLLGSTAERVLRRASCPVLVVPAKASDRD